LSAQGKLREECAFGCGIAALFYWHLRRWRVTLGEAMMSAWRQALGDRRDEVELEGKTYRVTVLRAKGLRMVEFEFGPQAIVGIEQNPKTASRWAELARQGNQIMQFRCSGRYVANVCEGKLLRYPAWKALELPE